MEIKIKKVYEDVFVPTRGSEQAAGYDLHAHLGGFEECEIKPSATMKIGTGIAAELPEGYFGAVFARSGLAAKKGLRPANCVGVIDSDYRGEIIVALHNDSEEPRIIQNCDRIAQLVILPYLNVTFKEVSILEETERGSGGFGSTDSTEVSK